MADFYLCPNKALVTTKSHRAAQLKLVTISLTVDRNSWVMTFILTKCYKEKVRKVTISLKTKEIT